MLSSVTRHRLQIDFCCQKISANHFWLSLQAFNDMLLHILNTQMKQTSVNCSDMIPGIKHTCKKDNQWENAFPVHTEDNLAHVACPLGRVTSTEEWWITVGVCRQVSQGSVVTKLTCGRIKRHSTVRKTKIKEQPVTLNNVPVPVKHMTKQRCLNQSVNQTH